MIRREPLRARNDLHHTTDPQEAHIADEDARRRGWPVCLALGYGISPEACRSRRIVDREEPARHLCDPRCERRGGMATMRPKASVPTCAWAGCDKTVSGAGRMCRRHGQLSRNRRGPDGGQEAPATTTTTTQPSKRRGARKPTRAKPLRPPETKPSAPPEEKTTIRVTLSEALRRVASAFEDLAQAVEVTR